MRLPSCMAPSCCEFPSISYRSDAGPVYLGLRVWRRTFAASTLARVRRRRSSLLRGWDWHERFSTVSGAWIHRRG